MRKVPAAAAKPKLRARGKAKPKPKSSPDSISGASSPSGSGGSPSPTALGRGLLSASKPKPRARVRAKPKGKASHDSLSGASSPSASSGSPSQVAVGRGGFLSPSSPAATPKTRSPLTVAAMSMPAFVSTVGGLRGLAASSLDSLKCRLDALHLEASHSRISKRITMQTQSCVQMAEEAEEHKKMVDKVSQQAEEMKALSVSKPVDLG